MEVRRTRLSDFERIEAQAEQHIEVANLTPFEMANAVTHPSYTAVKNGNPIAMFGLLPISPGWYRAWGIVSTAARPHMLFITRGLRLFLETFRYNRIDMTADTRFERATRWPELLGFTRVATLRKAAPDGGDYILFERVKC